MVIGTLRSSCMMRDLWISLWRITNGRLTSGREGGIISFWVRWVDNSRFSLFGFFLFCSIQKKPLLLHSFILCFPEKLPQNRQILSLHDHIKPQQRPIFKISQSPFPLTFNKSSLPTSTDRSPSYAQWHNQALRVGLHGLCAAVFSRGLGMTSPEIEVLLAGVRKDLDNTDIHVFSRV